MLTQGQSVQEIRIGVDSGGTFTDIVLYNTANGEVAVWKVSSTPDDPSEGIMQGVTQTLTRFVSHRAQVVYFGHGTTVATNAVIQRKGAITGLITTQGFRDVAEIGRQVRPSLYNLNMPKPQALASRDLRLEVKERMTWKGDIQVPLDIEDTRRVARTLKAAGVQAVAVCLLHSYRNVVHEQQIKAILNEEMPETFISISSDIAPEYREFERTSTVLVNAYVGPVIQDYLRRLTRRLRDADIGVKPKLTQSNGGVISFEQAQQQPVRTILSGPAAGVVAASEITRRAGFPNIITFDMGGTSTDVALMENATPAFALQTSVHGHPLRVPMLDIETVGAGGGSIARVDDGGLLEVGPISAGAFPGPACYEKGNFQPTVTDANVVLQVLNPVSLLAGRMPISREAAKVAVTAIADPLGVRVEDAAQGIVSMAVANMVKAVRVVSVGRGHDPREFALFAFGGMGPVHATRLARELGISTVIVPKTPGVLCAHGLLLSDLKTDFSCTRLCPLCVTSRNEMEAAFHTLRDKASVWFADEGIAEPERSLCYSVDVRYTGQGHELNIPCAWGMDPGRCVDAIRTAFEQRHAHMYGYSAAEASMEITTFRAAAVAVTEKAPLRAYPAASTAAQVARMGCRTVYLPESGGWTDCPIYNRDLLGPAHTLPGPAIIEQMDCTTLILPAQHVTVDESLNLIIKEG